MWAALTCSGGGLLPTVDLPLPENGTWRVPDFMDTPKLHDLIDVEVKKYPLHPHQVHFNSNLATSQPQNECRIMQ